MPTGTVTQCLVALHRGAWQPWGRCAQLGESQGTWLTGRRRRMAPPRLRNFKGRGRNSAAGAKPAIACFARAQRALPMRPQINALLHRCGEAALTPRAHHLWKPPPSARPAKHQPPAFPKAPDTLIQRARPPGASSRHGRQRATKAGWSDSCDTLGSLWGRLGIPRRRTMFHQGPACSRCQHTKHLVYAHHVCISRPKRCTSRATGL